MEPGVVNPAVEGQKMPQGAFTGSAIAVKGNDSTTIAMGATYDGTREVDVTQAPKNS